VIAILLATAVLTELVCVVGVVAGATVYDRLHYAGATTAVAPFLVFAAIAVENGSEGPSWSAGFVAVALFVLNSVLSHVTARVARQRERGDVRL
jgi:multisubunit Na+/H+ antiporter MnhG subunit